MLVEMGVDDDTQKSTAVSLKEVKYVPRRDGEFELEVRRNKRDTAFLYFTILTGTSPLLAGSAEMAWPSSVIPKLLSNNTDVNPLEQPVTTVQISMMVGIPILFSLIGSLLAPFAADLLGRKRALQLLGFLMLLSEIVLAFSTHVISIIISRSIFFVCFFGILSVLPIYITEICESHNRAKFGSIWLIHFPLGNLFSYIIGPKCSYSVFTLIIALPLVAFLVLSSLTHETPVYLLAKGRKDECLKVLRSLRDKSRNAIQKDLEEIEASLNVGVNTKTAGICTLFKDRQGRLGVLLALVPMGLHSACGVGVIIAFLGPIFTAGGSNFSDTDTAIVGAFKLVCFCLTPFVIERAGRRFLMLLSSIGCGLSFFVTGFYFFLKHIDSPIADSVQWLPLVGVLFIILFNAVGMGPLPNSIMGELFAWELRSVAVSFLMTLTGIIYFAFQAGFPLLDESAGMHWCMWLFAINCSIGAVGVYLFLPETSGKTIDEIQQVIKNYKFRFCK